MKARLVLVAVLFAAGCSTTPPRSGPYYDTDRPPTRPPSDLEATPDAVPRPEPYSRYGNRPYTVFKKTYRPLSTHKGYRERGVASWYGAKFHKNPTSSGEPYDMYAMSAAHKTLPIPSYARVRNLKNGRSVVVRVNDRGPFLHGRLIDLSYAAAVKLGIAATGTGLVEVEAIDADAPGSVQMVKHSPLTAPQVFVQAGAFSERENAERLRERLVSAGFGSAHVAEQREGRTLYRVRIGPLASVEESDAVIARAAEHGVDNAHVAIE